MYLIWTILVLFCGISIYKKSIYSNPLKFTGYVYIFILISLFLNITRIGNLYDPFTEFLRYLSFFIIVNGLIYFTKDILYDNPFNHIKFFIFVVLSIQIIADLMYLSPLFDVMNYWFDLAKVSIARVRIPGTLENPNYISFLICSIYALTALVKNHFKNYEYILLTICSIILVFLSGSRTGLVCIILLLLLSHPKLSFFIIVFGGSELIKYFLLSNRFSFITTLNSFTQLLEISAFRIRYEIVMEAVNLIGEKPFFGYLETPISITDNFYIMFILRYGLVPFTILSIILIILGMQKLKYNYKYIWKLFPMVLTPIIFSLTGSFIDNFRLFFLWVLTLLLGYRYVQCYGFNIKLRKRIIN
jgi:hypothetical protein